jgi:hypothetical protein
MLVAVARALGHDPDRIPPNHRAPWTTNVRGLIALGAVPAEVPFRVETYRSVYGRDCRTPMELGRSWASLASALADQARAHRALFIAEGREPDEADAEAINLVKEASR